MTKTCLELDLEEKALAFIRDIIAINERYGMGTVEDFQVRKLEREAIQMTRWSSRLASR